MKFRWQYFLLGLLSGIFLSGIAAILFNLPGVMEVNHQKKGIVSNSGLVPETDQQLIFADQVETATLIPGKINLNEADIFVLMTLPNIGEIKARNIVEYREKYGDFENVDELLYVPGIGKSVLNGMRNLVFIE